MSILIFLVVLIVLILVHEFGHFAVAKLSGIRVDEFGIGFPPKLWGKKFGETEYTVNALPVGGFVRIWGEDPTEEHYEEGPESTRSFVKKPRIIQAAVLVAGVAMNILLAFVLYVTAFMIGIPTPVDEGAVPADATNVHLYVTSVLPGSPAADVLKPSDQIVAIHRGDTSLTSDGTLVPSGVSDFVSASGGDQVTFDVIRQGKTITETLVPKTGVIAEQPGRAAAGFTMSLVGLETLPFTSAVVQGAQRTYYSLIDIATGLGALASQLVHGTANLGQVAGPVGIVNLVGDAASLGFSWLLTFTAYISLNLAVINILPIPALDGGRLLMVVIEAVTRRVIKPIIATRLNQIGFMALLALMAIITVHDVLRLIG